MTKMGELGTSAHPFPPRQREGEQGPQLVASAPAVLLLGTGPAASQRAVPFRGASMALTGGWKADDPKECHPSAGWGLRPRRASPPEMPAFAGMTVKGGLRTVGF